MGVTMELVHKGAEWRKRFVNTRPQNFGIKVVLMLMSCPWNKNLTI